MWRLSLCLACVLPFFLPFFLCSNPCRVSFPLLPRMSATLQVPDWQQPVITKSTTPALIPPPSSNSTRISSSTKEKRLKLRASCDACAASKIRCSKEHPTCARCSTNKSQCVYGVSRKHGKPGRKRKRNPDGTLFVKAVKHPPSSTTTHAGKPTLQSEPQTAQDLLKVAPDWVSDWSSTLSLPDTSTYELKAASGPIYTNVDGFNANCTNNGFWPVMQPQPETCQTLDSQFLSQDPFTTSQLMQLDSSALQAPEVYPTSNLATPEMYPSDITTIPHFEPFSSPPQSTLYSPANQAVRHGRPTMASSLSIPPQPSNYGYNLAGSTFDSAYSWGSALLPSPVSDSVCSSSPSISGIVSPFMRLDVQHDAASNMYMQPWHFPSCGFDGDSADIVVAWQSERFEDMT